MGIPVIRPIRTKVCFKNRGSLEGTFFRHIIRYADVHTMDKVQIWIKFDNETVADMWVKDELIELVCVCYKRPDLD
jgi:hypothetical protein